MTHEGRGQALASGCGENGPTGQHSSRDRVCALCLLNNCLREGVTEGLEARLPQVVRSWGLLAQGLCPVPLALGSPGLTL